METDVSQSGSLPNYVNNTWKQSEATELIDVTNPRDWGRHYPSATFTRGRGTSSRYSRR